MGQSPYDGQADTVPAKAIVPKDPTRMLMLKKMAIGLASLYDADDSNGSLGSPIWTNKHNAFEGKDSIQFLEFESPELIFDGETEEDVGSILLSHTAAKSLSPRGSLTSSGSIVLDSNSSGLSDDKQGCISARASTFESDESELSSPTPMVICSEGEPVDDERIIRTEWIGTSQFYTDQGISLQSNGDLDCLIDYRKALIDDISITPYDPYLHLNLSRLYSKLGFTDIGLASAYKALLLTQAALNLEECSTFPVSLGSNVRKTLAHRLRSCHGVVNEDLRQLQVEGYRELLNGLLGCAAFWDGLVEAKKALQLSRNDEDLLTLQDYLKEGFQDRHNGLIELGAPAEDIVALTRTGKIYQKKYPWMAENLYMRSPVLVRELNKNFGAGNCEVRPVAFSSPGRQSVIGTENNRGVSLDVGALGIFATRRISQGDVIMADKCVTGISEIPASKLKFCDACHASLAIPFVRPSEIIQPECCKDVAFCSQECHYTATKGYHTVLCGKDWSWLYENVGISGVQGAGSRWKPILFLRVIAVVLADFRLNSKQAKVKQNPLQHPLLARMAANYSPPHKIHPDIPHDWQYFENIIAPMRILMLLGVNIFTDLDFTPETVQTIYWRIENNANMCKSNLSLQRRPSANSISYAFKPGTVTNQSPQSEDGNVNMVNLNPNYLFFNHSCEPNVSWYVSVPSAWASVEWLKGVGDEILKPGCSTVICRALRDINTGEELKISYVGDAKGDTGDLEGGRDGRRAWLKKWFEDGCGCTLCLRENEAEE